MLHSDEVLKKSGSCTKRKLIARGAESIALPEQPGKPSEPVYDKSEVNAGYRPSYRREPPMITMKTSRRMKKNDSNKLCVATLG